LMFVGAVLISPLRPAKCRPISEFALRLAVCDSAEKCDAAKTSLLTLSAAVHISPFTGCGA
jgi:hypothetical protein